MKKYININGEIFETIIVANKKALEDSMLNDNRRTGNSTGKRNLYLDKTLTSNLIDFFPEIHNDFQNQKSDNEKLVKVYFSILNFVNNNDLVNEKKEVFSDQTTPTAELLKNLKAISNDKSHFYIEANLSNAGYHGVSLKKWKENKEVLYDVLFIDTVFDLYVFKKDSDCYFYCEFTQINFDEQKTELTNPIDDKPISNTIYYGAPGTGKSHKVNEILEPLNSKFYERITFHPEFDNASFIGGYRPISENIENVEVIKYKFIPQAFTNIYVRAWNDLKSHYYLVIEEINRGNCAEIFGDIFQLLDRNSNYTVSPSNELKKHLNNVLINKEGINDGLKLPTNLSILATMNTSDQSLFPMDSAFKRRWDWEYIPINDNFSDDNKSSSFKVKISQTENFSWLKFILSVNSVIKQNDNLGMDKCLGNYFIKPKADTIEIEEFINKAVFYLWNDVFKDEMEENNIFKNKTTYEDFFPIKTKGIEKVKEILEFLNVEIVVV